jgi:hypothetical protein
MGWRRRPLDTVFCSWQRRPGRAHGATLSSPDSSTGWKKTPKSGYDFNARFVRPPGDLGIDTNCANYEQGDAAPTQDEEDFFPDIYNDELPDDGTIPNKKKKPDDTFGDQLDGGR